MKRFGNSWTPGIIGVWLLLGSQQTNKQTKKTGAGKLPGKVIVAWGKGPQRHRSWNDLPFKRLVNSQVEDWHYIFWTYPTVILFFFFLFLSWVLFFSCFWNSCKEGWHHSVWVCKVSQSPRRPRRKQMCPGGWGVHWNFRMRNHLPGALAKNGHLCL